MTGASAPTVEIRILSANVYRQNRQYDKVLDLVRSQSPDIAVFIDINEIWQQQLDTLGDLLPYSYGQSGSHLGLLVYSKRPLANVNIELFGTEDNVSVVAQIPNEDGPITFVATHPVPPLSSDIFRSRNQQIDLIGEYINSAPTKRRIAVGDLNITMWSPYYRRLVSKAGLHNTRKGFGILPTWPTHHPKIPALLAPFVRIPIDHCLVSEGFWVVNATTGSDIGSDHKPLTVDLAISNR
ncbi:MAG: endonuclease/exonuclease/phosphatase family protein [Cyanobacteria bacterium J06560_2]